MTIENYAKKYNKTQNSQKEMKNGDYKKTKNTCSQKGYKTSTKRLKINQLQKLICNSFSLGISLPCRRGGGPLTHNPSMFLYR